MSGIPHPQAQPQPDDGDRRPRKTREAILGAFSDLVVQRRRRYGEISVGDIVEDADVGRSTFYEHYKSKDDMMLASMSPMLDVMATAVTDQPALDHLEGMMAHFLDMRTFAREVLWGPNAQHLAPRITRELAKRVEVHLGARSRETPVVPLELIAAQIAEAQFALVRAWLAGDARARPGEVALAMCRSARASALALVR